MKPKIFFCLALVLSDGLFAIPRIALALPQEPNQSKVEWNLEKTLEAYQEVGKTNSAWDEPVKRALTEYASITSGNTPQNEIREAIIRTNCDLAINAGCDDPMVRYMYARYSMCQTNTPLDIAKASCDIALDMQKSAYPNVLKFYAADRAVIETSWAYGSTNSKSISVEKEFAPLIRQNLVAVLQDKTTPPEEVYEDCADGLNAFSSEDCIQTYSMIEPLLFTNWPDATSWLVKGKAYIDMAWNARGNGFVDTVTDEGWEVFSNDLAIAESALSRAWELNPKDARIADAMMKVELGQGQGRERLELWFDRAMELNPNDYDACWTKLQYLEPKWHGSVHDMVQFNREILQHTNWDGRIPLLVVDAHVDIWDNYLKKSQVVGYWKRPQVHSQIETAYEQYFRFNSNAPDIDKDYALRAFYMCRWQEFIKLVSKIRPIDYNSSSFGDINYAKNKNYLDKLVQYARGMIQYDKKHPDKKLAD